MSAAHSPYDWTLLCDDPECGCQDVKDGRSATKAGTLRCRICGQDWPCETKRSHHPRSEAHQ